MVEAAQQLSQTPAPRSGVQVNRGPQAIPTFLPAPPDRYPAYLDNRVYQGMSGAVYPLPFHERISSERSEHEWDVVTVSNEWVELAILPELGGRIAWGLDRTKDYDFFYRNQVIKPALVGLAGPWISGGVELNWPQHHRPATFLPTSVTIEHEDDGAVTVWCSDHDPFARMKGMHGVRLRPDSAVIELRVRLLNRTADVQTFLWWANVAARAGDHYQAFFPTDVHYVADHARRAITAFPAADRPYYGWDYPAQAERVPDGDRIDWYRNVRVPTSYMCLQTADDFFGGYDHGVGAGFVHIADHRISPGKKMWTWGNAPFGWAWDRNLTEVDGPYVELMAGVYTDNQPDFTFLAPGETKTFSQFWYPIQEIGPAQQANLDAAVAFEVAARGARVGIALPKQHDQVDAEIIEITSGKVLWQLSRAAGPGNPIIAHAELGADLAPHEVQLRVRAEDRELISWTPREPVADPVEPEPATEPPAPAEIESSDELYITGLHLDQYHHSTRKPEPYWLEAVRRDPGDSRCRTQLARKALSRGQFAEAEEHLGHGLARLRRRNPNPYDTEALYLLGQLYERTGRGAAALDAYGKSGWDAAWRGPAQSAMARLLAARGENHAALELIEGEGTPRDPNNQARCLEVILLRRLHRSADAELVLDWLRSHDPLDVWAADLAGERIGTDAPTLLDVALDYAAVGEHGRALELLTELTSLPLPPGQVNVVPLALLHRADLLFRLGRTDEAARALQDAAAADATWCFASRPADLDMLTRLTAARDDQPLAFRLLGQLLYHLDRRPDAMAAWQRAIELADDDPVTRRNLAVASHNVADDPAAADAHYRRARELAPADARLLYEHDQLCKRTGASPAERLAMLEAERGLVTQRDDLTVEYLQLLTTAGRPDDALEVLETRSFQPWEGGEGQVLAAWEAAWLAKARAQLAAGDASGSEESVRRALDPIESLGEARHPLANQSALLTALGDAQAAGGNQTEAGESWTQATSFVSDFRTMAAVPYSDLTYYSVRAAQRLGQADRAEELTHGLEEWADQLASQTPKVQFFATSLPSLLLFTDDLERRNRVEVALLRAQVAALRADEQQARQHLGDALREDPNQPMALELQRELDAFGAAEQ